MAIFLGPFPALVLVNLETTFLFKVSHESSKNILSTLF